MRILIVAPNISMRMGGEAVLPYHYVREFQRAGVDVFALTHARVRDELRQSELWREGAFHFVEDTLAEKSIFAVGKRAPGGVADALFNPMIAMVTMQRLGARARALSREMTFDVVHQPIPVSPQFPSFLTGVDAPVIIGPMNGAMNFPAGFERDYSQGSEISVRAGRALSGVANTLVAGKRSAARILVSNERTRAALPSAIDRSRVGFTTDNGVDLDLWTLPRVDRETPPLFMFVGRLIRLKAVDILIDAFAKLEAPARLVIIGDGPERGRLEAQAARVRNSAQAIEFLGFRPQSDIRDVLARATALVFPSLRDCGGAVIIEAFACRTPVIASDWGGPQDYVTPDTGILVPPTDRASLVDGIAAAVSALAKDPARVSKMGDAARRVVEERYSWKAKAHEMIDLYGRVIAERK